MKRNIVLKTVYKGIKAMSTGPNLCQRINLRNRGRITLGVGTRVLGNDLHLFACTYSCVQGLKDRYY